MVSCSISCIGSISRVSSENRPRAFPGDSRRVITSATTFPTLLRRETLFLGCSSFQLCTAPATLALIPGNDDDDEQLLAKAKAGRAERIQAERVLEKNYVTKNELKLDADSSKLQLAVFKLSKAGALIDSGYLALAAEVLTQGSWEAELVGTGNSFRKDPRTFIDDLSLLKSACVSGDEAKAKSYFIMAARSLRAYAAATNTTEILKLL